MTVGDRSGGFNLWPFIQTFDLDQGGFEVKLDQPGNDEIVTLTYDGDVLDDYASLTLDRNSAPRSAEIHVTITDRALNIDPTDEDVVIFYNDQQTPTSSSMMWTNGSALGTGATGDKAGMGSYFAQTRSVADFDKNGKLMINHNVAGIGYNATVPTAATLDDLQNDNFFLFTETGDNTSVFSNTDDTDEASIEVNSKAARGTTALFDYNDSPQSFKVAHFTATVDMDEASVGDEWNSGEKLTVSITDEDFNTNSLTKQKKVIGSKIIPTIIVGSPLTLSDSSMVARATVAVDTYSKIANVTATGATDVSTQLMVTPGFTFTQYHNATYAADYVFINYNISSLITTTDVTRVI